MHTEAEILDWLVTAIAKEMQIAPEAIDPSKSIHVLGIDSAMVIALTFDLETKFGVFLDLAALFQAQSLQEFATQLAVLIQKQSLEK